jgi:hypothetical protein
MRLTLFGLCIVCCSGQPDQGADDTVVDTIRALELFGNRTCVRYATVGGRQGMLFMSPDARDTLPGVYVDSAEQARCLPSFEAAFGARTGPSLYILQQ